MRAQFDRRGELKYDYTGSHVVYHQDGRRILGTITGTFRDEDEVLHFTVRHFNGEAAPDVPCGCVQLLTRGDYVVAGGGRGE